ncbi:GTPase-activating protein and VPS9 domain-containing protein 1-like isoform X3 [Clavelina lepadiformis]|uniref:GTPase-activating protein and VPS9 domain-containing protein 1-like isoform X3 n=1 Tax=Clavelina lepadiformis TaxID=159417 RepID=UPI0040410677
MSHLTDLARRLHEERLFIRHEQDTIWKLNEQVQLNAEQLSHLFWITRQQYLNLNKLIVNSSQVTPSACSRRAHQLDSVQFVDAYKELGYQESMYSQFLEAFINNPTLAAACLAYGDKLGLETTNDVACIIVLNCYGNRLITDDHKHLLELMETLMLLQLAGEDQPRRLLQKGSCAFSVVFKLFNESLLVGKLFLTSALYQPVMEVLMDDELFLETNPQKVLSRLNPIEIERRFGKQDSAEFQEKLNQHVKCAEENLANICSNFIENLLAAMCGFPQSLGWIIARSYHIVKEAGLVTQAEARALCADFLLQQFVCPAIVNPELHGVTGDVPVSDLTRFNLMQVAQVLQVMAHWNESSQQSNTFHGRLNKEPMKQLIDTVINSCNFDGVPPTHVAPHGYASAAVFFTPSQLHQLIRFLQDIQAKWTVGGLTSQSDVRGVDQATLASILSHLPSQPPQCMRKAASQNGGGSGAEGVSQATSSGHLSPSGGSSTDLMGGTNQHSPTSDKKRAKTVKVKNKMPKREDSIDSNMDEIAAGDSATINQVQLFDSPETVLVISMASSSSSSHELPGTMSEQEVMELQNSQSNQHCMSNLTEDASLDAATLAEAEGLDKRSRFSLYSGGSDLSEVGEELPTEDGISRTSGSSSMDLDHPEGVPADDASSIHAVSSRGGNQDEDEEGGDQESVTHANNDEALKALRRKLPTSRESIEDKMRKFEIRQEVGVRFADLGVTGGPRRDESGPPGGPGPVDARSDTWSMDVYASDSEPPAEQDSQSERLREIAEDPAEHMRNPPSSISSLLTLTRDDDSRSDVWSVEVLPSDSEPPDIRSEDRLKELESESGNAGTEDVMEDSRSRASTPGLSAASGFSGVSGLSLDNHPAKVVDEQWVNSERSFGKGPNSISPDAEDLHISRGESASAGSSHGGGGSSNSSETNEKPPPTSSASPSPQLQLASQSPVSIVLSSKQRGEAMEVSRQSVSFDENVKKGNDEDNDHVQTQKVEVVEKNVAWDITSSSEVPVDNKSLETSGLALMDFDENMSTIKRSPYKRPMKDMPKSDKSESSDADQPAKANRVIAWDEKAHNEAPFTPAKVSITVNNNAITANDQNHTSAFVPVSPKNAQNDILKDFDPLAEAGSNNSVNLHVATDKRPQTNERQNNDINLNSVSATLVEIHPAAEITKESKPEIHSDETPKEKPNVKSPNLPRQKSSTLVDYEGLNVARNKAIDRKKSWWKPNRFPSLSKRKPTGKLNGPLNYGNAGSVGNDGPRRSGNYDGYAAQSDVPPARSKSAEEVSPPGEDIMEKYMKKVTSNQQTAGRRDVDAEASAHKKGSVTAVWGDSSFQSDLTEPQNASGSTATDVHSPQSDDTVTTTAEDAASVPVVDDWPVRSPKVAAEMPSIPVACPSKSFESISNSDTDLKEDAKRKLRIVLASAEPLPEPPSPALLLLGISSVRSDLRFRRENNSSLSAPDGIKLRDQLLSFLRVQQAEALTLQHHSKIAQIDEVMRCVNALDDAGCKHVFKNLWREYKSRSCFIAYLVRARQHLLSASSYLRHVTECTERDRAICRRYFTSQCVRLFLKSKEEAIKNFRGRFMRSIALDEKVTLVGDFLSWLYGQMVEHQIWEGASSDQLVEVESSIERTIFSYVHKLAMFPNGDGDVLRDQLFHEHICRLSAVITPFHPSLQVRRKYLSECPWPSAQREARALAAHRSPRGKLDGALRCCSAVMHLLKLADENQAPGADDITPVLVFVLIKANPPHLLSTVQYVNSFIGDHLTGEDAYWWMQFTAATEFIKTIDERK